MGLGEVTSLHRHLSQPRGRVPEGSQNFFLLFRQNIFNLSLVDHLGKLQHFPGKLKVASVLGSNGISVKLFAFAWRINLHLNILRIRFFVRSLGEVLLRETIESLEMLVQGLSDLPSNL